MYYETMPLYPSLRTGCDRDACVRMPIFEGERCPGGPPDGVRECRRVTIENPCRPGECAEVLLGLDACGNLVVCVHREPRGECERPCRPRRREPRCLPEPCCPPPPRRGCGRGRLYGTWN